MKKILLTIILFFVPFFIYAEECDTDKINVKSIELIDKTNGVEEYEPPVVRDGIIYVDMRMSYLNDSAEYRVVLENASNQDFDINKSLTNDSKYIEYKLEPADDTYVINKNSSEEFILTIKYINKVDMSDFVDEEYTESKDILININEYFDNGSGKPIINPETGINLAFIVLIGLVGVALLVLVFYLRNKRMFFVLLLFVLLIPLAVKAICTKDIKISSRIVINQTYEGMLMGRNGSSYKYLRTNYDYDTIEKIIFTNSIAGHTVNNTDCFDVSVDNDGSVLAWASNIDSDGFVTLTIGAEGKVYASSGYNLFGYLVNLESIEGMQYFDTSYVTDMRYMFAGCITLRSIDLSHFNTSKVTDMGSMFSMAVGSSFPESALEALDLRSFDTSNVFNMGEMFLNCNNITSLNISSFNTSNVTDMHSMFSQCHSLTSLDLSNFNTSNVINMDSMFKVCEDLTSLNISSFNTSKVVNMSGMFNYCYNLSTIDLSNFDTSSVTNMGSMFANCSSLTTLDLSSFNTSNVTNMSYMFRRDANLRTILVSTLFVTANLTGVNSSSAMFEGCTSLVGGSGTVYDPNHINKDYAHVDYANSSPSNPGYFTIYSNSD